MMIKKRELHCRIPAEMVRLLTQQIERENNAYFLYLSAAIQCEADGYPGVAHFLYLHAEEERAHMMRIVRYLTEVDAEVELPAMQKLPSLAAMESLHQLFEQLMAEEVANTQAFHHLVEQAQQLRDYRSFDFLQFFLGEQREEEQLLTRALDLIAITGEEGTGRHLLDKAFASLHEEAATA